MTHSTTNVTQPLIIERVCDSSPRIYCQGKHDIYIPEGMRVKCLLLRYEMTHCMDFTQ